MLPTHYGSSLLLTTRHTNFDSLQLDPIMPYLYSLTNIVANQNMDLVN